MNVAKRRRKIKRKNIKKSTTENHLSNISEKVKHFEHILKFIEKENLLEQSNGNGTSRQAKLR